MRAVENSRYDVIIANFANADMVGHTGNLTAAIKAVECLDSCLEQIHAVVHRTGSQCLVTADHGNVEQLQEMDLEQPHTAHTIGLVPLVYDGNKQVQLRSYGGLQDVAPTMLELMQIKQPLAMTGQSLIR